MAVVSAYDSVTGKTFEIEGFVDLSAAWEKTEGRELEVKFVSEDAPGEEWRFNEMDVDHHNLEDYFDLVEDLDGDQMAALYLLVDQLGYVVSNALDRIDDVQLTQDTKEQYVDDLLDDVYDVPASLRRYIDVKSLASDMESNGELIEFEFGGTDYVCTNASGF